MEVSRCLKKFGFVIVLSVCVFNIYPTHDDWGYASPSKVENLLSRLMPSKTFWRPLDALYGYLLGYAPYLFPQLNHAIVLVGHFILCVILFFLLRKFTKRKSSLYIGTLFFCLSPGIVASITQTDYINQIWAMVAGVTSCFYFLKTMKINRKIYYLLWLSFAFLATLIKENGIVWFIAPVMFNFICNLTNSNENLKELIKKHIVLFLIGILGICLYFAVRFILMGEIALGNSVNNLTSTVKHANRYTIDFSLFNIVKNYCYVFGGAATSIDTLAFFLKPRNWIVLFITSLVSILFILCLCSGLVGILKNKQRVFYLVIGLFICAGFISSPYVVMGHAGEVTAYEMTFSLAVILGIILDNAFTSRIMKIITVLMFICMIGVSAHKFWVMHDYTSSVNSFLIEHKADFKNTPSKIFVYFVEDIPEEGHASYRYPIGHGLGNGHAFKSLWNWKPEIKTQSFKNMDDVNFTPESLPEYDTVFILTQSGSLKILRN